MSGVEAYVVKTTMALDLTQQLAGIREMAQAWKGVADQLKTILDLQKQVSARISDGSGAFAANMEKGQRAAEATAAAAERVARAPLQIGFDPNWRSTPNVVYGGGPAGGAYVPPQPQYFSGQNGPPVSGGAAWQPQDEKFNEGPINLFNVTGKRPTYGDYYAAGYGTQLVGNAAGGLVDGSFMAAAGKDQLLGALKAQGFTDEQATAAMAAAVKTQQTVLGTYVSKNLLLIVQLQALTQDANASISMLPEMAKAQQVLSGLGRNGEADISAAMRSAEMRGILFKDGKADLPAINTFLKNMEAVAEFSGGQYGPAEVYQMLRSAGVAGTLMSDENGLAEMMPLLQSIGPARAGTALRGFSQQFSAGKMSEGGLNLLAEMGIILHPENARKIGFGQFQLTPGAMAPGAFEMATLHPEQYVLETLLPAVDKYLAKNYGEKFTNGDDKTRLAYESAAMQQIASRIPGGVFDSEVVRLAPLIARDVQAFKNASGRGDAYNTAVAQNPLMQLEGYKAAVNALMIQLGDANMAVSIAALKSITAALNTLEVVMSSAGGQAIGAELMLIADALKIIASVTGAVLVLAPAIFAAQKIAASLGLVGAAGAGATAAGAGGLALKAVPAIGGLVIAADQFMKDMDPNNRTGIWGIMKEWGQEISAAIHGQKIEVYIDGDHVATRVVKKIASAAGGPSSGNVGHDPRNQFTPPGNN